MDKDTIIRKIHGRKNRGVSHEGIFRGDEVLRATDIKREGPDNLGGAAEDFCRSSFIEEKAGSLPWITDWLIESGIHSKWDGKR